MSIFVNNTLCDTYAYLDEEKCGETLLLSVAKNQKEIKVFLFCDKKPFPIYPNSEVKVECYILNHSTGTLVECQKGDGGEIITEIPDELFLAGQHLLCEINVSIEKVLKHRARATTFCVYMTE